MEAYLDYLSLRYAIRLHFLPTHHALEPPHDLADTRTNLPGLHRLYNLSKHLVQGKLEDRTAMSTAPGVAKTTSPNPDKTTQPRQLHEKWLRTLTESTIVIYTDGSKLDNGNVGCGWTIHYSRNQQLHFLSDGCCHLGRRAEVYDTELHAVQEAVTRLLITTAPRAPVFICIDNQAAADALRFNASNHEYAPHTLNDINNLQHLGWHVSTVWCPAYCGIRGNERANFLAKSGASDTVPCRFALTTKTWLLAQARKKFLKRWKDELPLSRLSFKFSDHLHGVDWADTHAMWRVFCNRSHSDSPPNITANPCPCGLSLNSSHHLLRDCSLLATERATLLRSTTGDIQTASFIIVPKNTQPIRRFLRATSLDHSTRLCFDKADDSTIDGADNPSSGSPEPDFDAFEP